MTDPDPCPDCTPEAVCREHDGDTIECDGCHEVYPAAATTYCARHWDHYCAPCALDESECAVCDLPVMPCCVTTLAGCTVHVGCREESESAKEAAAEMRWENRRDWKEYQSSRAEP